MTCPHCADCEQRVARVRREIATELNTVIAQSNRHGLPRGTMLDEIARIADRLAAAPAAEGGATFSDFQRDVYEWAQRTFPGSTLAAKLAHLRRELDEIQQQPTDAHEWADAFLILLHGAASYGHDLLAAAREKFALVQQRKWGAPDAQGVIEHVRTEPPP